MKYKYLVTATVLSLILATPIAGDTVEYSDDYVSFSYDDEMIGQIWKWRVKENAPLMYILTSGVRKDDITECIFGVAKKDRADPESDPNTKVLQESDDYYAYLFMSAPDDKSKSPDWVKIFYDSFTFNSDINSLMTGGTVDDLVYLNVELSDQCYVYAEKALETLNGYMNMSLSEADAVSAIEDLQARIDSYAEDSDYYFDGDLKRALALTNLDLMMEEDGKIQKTIDELNMFLGNE